MAHYISAFLSHEDFDGWDDPRLAEHRRVRLKCGLAMLPTTVEFMAALGAPTRDSYGYMVVQLTSHGLEGIPKEIIEWASHASRSGPLSYIATDYHGGTGRQLAIVWRNGVIEYAACDPERRERPKEPWAINGALTKFFGVQRENAHDEFDAIGLDTFRYMQYFTDPDHSDDYYAEDWIDRYRARWQAR